MTRESLSQSERDTFDKLSQSIPAGFSIEVKTAIENVGLENHIHCVDFLVINGDAKPIVAIQLDRLYGETDTKKLFEIQKDQGLIQKGIPVIRLGNTDQLGVDGFGRIISQCAQNQRTMLLRSSSKMEALQLALNSKISSLQPVSKIRKFGFKELLVRVGSVGFGAYIIIFGGMSLWDEAQDQPWAQDFIHKYDWLANFVAQPKDIIQKQVDQQIRIAVDQGQENIKQTAEDATGMPLPETGTVIGQAIQKTAESTSTEVGIAVQRNIVENREVVAAQMQDAASNFANKLKSAISTQTLIPIPAKSNGNTQATKIAAQCEDVDAPRARSLVQNARDIRDGHVPAYWKAINNSEQTVAIILSQDNRDVALALIPSRGTYESRIPATFLKLRIVASANSCIDWVGRRGVDASLPYPSSGIAPSNERDYFRNAIFQTTIGSGSNGVKASTTFVGYTDGSS